MQRYVMTTGRKSKDVAINFSHEGKVNGNSVRIAKTLKMPVGKNEIRVDYELDGVFSGLFGVEMNISLLGSPDALIEAGGETLNTRSTAVHDNIKTMSLFAGYLKLGIEFSFDEPVGIWHYPVETVSLSEQGIERLYQGTSFMMVLPLALRGQHSFGFTIRFQEEAS